jgi:hypothetical protein
VKQILLSVSLIVMVAVMAGGCKESGQASKRTYANPDLVGAWRAKIQFQTGAYSAIKDLEFMYAFHADGTMTESSNYDAFPPVPPAYGIWRLINDSQYVAKYEFYMTRFPDSTEHQANGSGWLPAGRGVLVDTITLTDDRKTFSSKIHLDALDQAGKRVSDGAGDATGSGVKMKF